MATRRNAFLNSNENHIDVHTSKHGHNSKDAFKKDGGNILFLFFLYVLQGIPLGLAGSIPMILQNTGVSYKEQATFSLAFWPFSVKLLWAPLVDSCYFSTFGRRKSWLVPAQYFIGFFMILLSVSIDSLLGDTSTHKPNVLLLTCIFFALSFLAATQDVAVDGWALTILSRDNVGWASTCNSVGQNAGFFVGYVVFLALESNDFCVNYLGQSGSLVSLAGFLYFWGIVFLITTTLVWAFKTETEENDTKVDEIGMVETYKVLGKMLQMSCIKKIIIFYLTCKIGFAAADSLTVLKLTEAGVPKDRLALLSVPLVPVQIVLPLVISRYTAGPRPMDLFLQAYPFRLFFGLVFAGLVWATPSFQMSDGLFPLPYYALIVICYLLHQITTNCMYVSAMAFSARISDPTIGGTYMTLLNTFCNLGGNWPAWVALRFVPELTWSSCHEVEHSMLCTSEAEKEECRRAGGNCQVDLDGYYVESAVFVVVGLLWLQWGRGAIERLQTTPLSSWLVSQKSVSQDTAKES